MNTPTPRTDSQKLWIDCDDSCCQTWVKNEAGELITGDIVSSYFAQQLERELTAANSKLAELKGLCLYHLRHYDSCAKRVKFSNKCSCGLDAAIKKVREM